MKRQIQYMNSTSTRTPLFKSVQFGRTLYYLPRGLTYNKSLSTPFKKLKDPTNFSNTIIFPNNSNVEDQKRWFSRVLWLENTKRKILLRLDRICLLLLPSFCPIELANVLVIFKLYLLFTERLSKRNACHFIVNIIGYTNFFRHITSKLNLTIELTYLSYSLLHNRWLLVDSHFFQWWVMEEEKAIRMHLQWLEMSTSKRKTRRLKCKSLISVFKSNTKVLSKKENYIMNR